MLQIILLRVIPKELLFFLAECGQRSSANGRTCLMQTFVCEGSSNSFADFLFAKGQDLRFWPFVAARLLPQATP